MLGHSETIIILTNHGFLVELNIREKQSLNNCKENLKMSKICEICKKGPQVGRTYKRRGMVRRKGGAGSKITGKTPRLFLPNLQRVKVILNGIPKRINVCTKCLKAGKVTKAV